MISTRQCKLFALAISCSLVLFFNAAQAAPFTSLVIFGDSLSDVGNIASSSFGIYPGRYYSSNRFSNGAVWVETLATGLGLPANKRSTLAGGNNFAYGGAQTSGTGGFEGSVIRDLDEQVTQYLNQRTVDPTGLYVVFAGSNDLIGGQTNVAVPANNLLNDVARLYSAGVRNFLSPNLPLLGYTPRFNGDATTAATYNARSTQFNAAVDAGVAALANSDESLALFRLDVASIFVDAITNPSKFNLTNVTAPAAPGLEPGDSSYDTSLIAPNASEYLFWDDLHPTATVHSILAVRALALVDGVAGDFDADALVDAADLALWRMNFGVSGAATRALGDANADQIVDGADFLLWQRNAKSAAVTMVPEPQAWLLIAGCAMFTRLQRRR